MSTHELVKVLFIEGQIYLGILVSRRDREGAERPVSALAEALVAAQRYVLTVPCWACNRETGMTACDLCARIETTERAATGVSSPQLTLAALAASLTDSERAYVASKRRPGR